MLTITPLRHYKIVCQFTRSTNKYLINGLYIGNNYNTCKQEHPGFLLN
jgi:hypothetical protein